MVQLIFFSTAFCRCTGIATLFIGSKHCSQRAQIDEVTQWSSLVYHGPECYKTDLYVTSCKLCFKTLLHYGSKRCFMFHHGSLWFKPLLYIYSIMLQKRSIMIQNGYACSSMVHYASKRSIMIQNGYACSSMVHFSYSTSPDLNFRMV